MRLWSVLPLVAVSPLALWAQVTLTVRDTLGVAIPFSVVNVNRGGAQVADSEGRITFRELRSDSVRLRARRIGFREFDGWVRPSGGTAEVRLVPIAQELVAVNVVARTSTPLSRSGFYDRVDRVRRGAIVGEFITPEELDERNQSLTSNILQGRRYVRIGTEAGVRNRPVLLGRGRCGMTILVDGRKVHNTLEDRLVGEAPTSIERNGTGRSGSGYAMDINEIVDGRSIMAVEIYPSTANAPVELQTLGGRGSCGIVAIWTGPRQ